MMESGYILLPIETKNTLGCFLPGGLVHEQLREQRISISEFQAEGLMKAGYRIVYVGAVDDA